MTAPVTTLDSYAYRHSLRPIRLVKIDMEGFEPEVVRGLENTLSEAILLEHNAKMLLVQGNTLTGASDALAERGYVLHRLGMRGTLRPATTTDQFVAAARRWDFEHESKSRLKVGLGTRQVLSNAIAIHETSARSFHGDAAPFRG